MSLYGHSGRYVAFYFKRNQLCMYAGNSGLFSLIFKSLQLTLTIKSCLVFLKRVYNKIVKRKEFLSLYYKLRLFLFNEAKKAPSLRFFPPAFPSVIRLKNTGCNRPNVSILIYYFLKHIFLFAFKPRKRHSSMC